MKISNELRHIINSKFPVYAGNLSHEDAAQLVIQAGKKEPAIKKALDSLNSVIVAFKQAEKELLKFGIKAFEDGDWRLDDPKKLVRLGLISLPPAPETRNQVLSHLATLTPAEGVKYLKALGIDWS